MSRSRIRRDKFDDLRVICTDRGQHNPRELGEVSWREDVPVALKTMGELPRDLGEMLWIGERNTGAGMRPKASVMITTRSDGGQTFTLPPCPVCGRVAVLRDDTIAGYYKKTFDTPLCGVLDISQTMC